MVYSDNVAIAMRIAYNIHHMQSDKGGYPYIHHVMHVAEQMDTEDEVIVALLHDTVEDGGSGTWNLISGSGFNTKILDALNAITRGKGEKYFNYILRVSTNDLARKVKIADLKHNMTRDRGNISDTLMDRYQKALKILELSQ